MDCLYKAPSLSYFLFSVVLRSCCYMYFYFLMFSDCFVVKIIKRNSSVYIPFERLDAHIQRDFLL